MQFEDYNGPDDLLADLKELENCCICPRNCMANRFSSIKGFCNSDAGFNIASVCIHRGEEPVISGKKGICNVFFSCCNMQCSYCQNYQISWNDIHADSYRYQLNEVLSEIIKILDSGVDALGFVSPSHFLPQVKIIIKALQRLGRKPIIVYNTNGYDTVTSIRQMEGLADVYLPDFKYMDDRLSELYSASPRYSEFASNAIAEMYRQKGSTLLTNENNYAESGLIIRHLVLPGHVENSLAVLRKIAEDISVNVHISLMSQYHPNILVKDHPTLGRLVSIIEYTMVTHEMEKLGFTKGWIQELNSSGYYQPDFAKPNPFGD
jgi:putative pyruvate formate lyase activating enzyme